MKGYIGATSATQAATLYNKAVKVMEADRHSPIEEFSSAVRASASKVWYCLLVSMVTSANADQPGRPKW